MKIVAISDTHGKHRELTPADIPDGDILIHCGDITKHGRINEVEDFLNWFSKMPHENKIFIAGNHDFCMKNASTHSNYIPDKRKHKQLQKIITKHWYEDNIQYLHNSGKTINGVSFFGSPYSDTLPRWAFNSDKEENQGVWKNILDFTEVLITHGPPYNENDYAPGYGHIGSKKLKQKRDSLDNLKYHVYGHVHGEHGKAEGNPYSLNASLLDDDYEYAYNPVVFNV